MEKKDYKSCNIVTMRSAKDRIMEERKIDRRRERERERGRGREIDR